MDKKRFGELFLKLWSINVPERVIKTEIIQAYWEGLKKFDYLEEMFDIAFENDWNNKFPSYIDLKKIALSVKENKQKQRKIKYEEEKKVISKEEKEAIEKSRNKFVFVYEFLRLFRCKVEWIDQKISKGELEVPENYTQIKDKSPDFMKNRNIFLEKYKKIIDECPKIKNNIFHDGALW